MSTYIQVQDRINLDYLNRSDLSAETQRSILAAIRSYRMNSFWWNENVTTLTTVAAQSFLSVPTDFIKLETLQITRNSADYILRQCTMKEILEFNVTRRQGWPTDFAIYLNRFNLSPIPDTAYTAPCYYIRELTALSATSDTNDWLSAAEDLIVYTATKLMWANVIRDNDEAVKFAQLERNELVNLKKYGEQRILSGIRATNF